MNKPAKVCKLPECNNPVTRNRAVFCTNECGNISRNRTYRDKHRLTPKYLERMQKASLASHSKPLGRYNGHKSNAKRRGVDFRFTFEEWWEIWKPHWKERGLGGLVMCRHNDQGAYEVGNVRIDTCSNNMIEANEIRRMNKFTDREVEELENLETTEVEQIPPEFYETYANDGMYIDNN